MLHIKRIYDEGRAHLEAGRWRNAEASFRTVLGAEPAFAMAHYSLGVALSRREQWQEAADAFRSATAAAPDLALAYAALGAALLRLGHHDEGEAKIRKATELDPHSPFAFQMLAEILKSRGELRAARAIYRSILATTPDEPDARFAIGFLDLLEGNLEAGWKGYEYRLPRRAPPPPALKPQWRGQNPANKTILLYAEQGLGDTLQFLRYATPLAERGAKVFVAVPPTLMELASHIEGVHEIVPPSPSMPPFDYCAPLPSLPFFCRTTLSNIPCKQSYLSPPTPVNPLVPPPAGDDMLTVCLAWAGNPVHPDDRNRSIPVREIAPLLRIENIRWLILQRGAGAAELDGLGRADVVQLGDRLNNFSDIASVVCAADLTITVDTSFCHLAGALGRPVWTLLPYVPDWRWMLGRDDSPWYPSMRLFRQPSPRDWPSVIATVAEALGADADVSRDSIS